MSAPLEQIRIWHDSILYAVRRMTVDIITHDNENQILVEGSAVGEFTFSIGDDNPSKGFMTPLDYILNTLTGDNDDIIKEARIILRSSFKLIIFEFETIYMLVYELLQTVSAKSFSDWKRIIMREDPDVVTLIDLILNRSDIDINNEGLNVYNPNPIPYFPPNVVVGEFLTYIIQYFFQPRKRILKISDLWLSFLSTYKFKDAIQGLESVFLVISNIFLKSIRENKIENIDLPNDLPKIEESVVIIFELIERYYKSNPVQHLLPYVIDTYKNLISIIRFLDVERVLMFENGITTYRSTNQQETESKIRITERDTLGSTPGSSTPTPGSSTPTPENSTTTPGSSTSSQNNNSSSTSLFNTITNAFGFGAQVNGPFNSKRGQQ